MSVLISKYNSPSSRGALDGVGSVRYDLVWCRGLQASIEKVSFKHAGDSEDVVPSIYTTLGHDIRIDKLYSKYGQLNYGDGEEKLTNIFVCGGTVIIDFNPSWMVNHI